MRYLLLFILSISISIQAATSSQVQVFGTIADLVARGNPSAKPNSFYNSVNVQGYWSPGDLGGGNFVITNSVTGTNFGTMIYSGVGTLSWLRIDPGPMSIKWFGVKGNMDSGDAARTDNAIATIGTNGGCIKWPVGRYKINALIPSGVVFDCEGSSIRAAAPLGTHSQTANGVCFFPSDLSKPVIKFGSSWGAPTPGVHVRNSGVMNACIMGSISTTNLFGDCAVEFAGGSQFCWVDNCQIGFAKHALRVVGESGAPNYANTVRRCTITMPSYMTDSSSNDFRGIYVSAPTSGTVAGFCTSFRLSDNCNIEGGPYGYNIEIDGVEIYLNDTYSDSFESSFARSHSVLLNHTATTAYSINPIIHGGYLDGGGLQVIVNFDNGTGAGQNTMSYYADGTTAAGAIQFFDGNILPFESGTGGPGSQYFTYSYPVVFGQLFFRPPGIYNSMATNATASAVSISADSSLGLTLKAGSKIAFYPGGNHGIQQVSATPRIDLTMNAAPYNVTNFFPNASITVGVTNITISPPRSYSSVVVGSTVIDGLGLNATADGIVTTPSLVVPGTAKFGGNILGVSSNITVIATNQIQVYSTGGTILVGRNSTNSFLYMFDDGTSSLATITSSSGSLAIAPSGSGAGTMTVVGNQNFTGLVQFVPPNMTKAQRNGLTARAGAIIYQTDNTPGIRFYDNGAWVKPTTTADP